MENLHSGRKNRGQTLFLKFQLLMKAMGNFPLSLKCCICFCSGEKEPSPPIIQAYFPTNEVKEFTKTEKKKNSATRVMIFNKYF